MMMDLIPKNQNGAERLRILKHKGIQVLLGDFSGFERSQSEVLLKALVERLESEAEGSVRLLIDARDATHDSSQTNEWKRHVPLFNSRLVKSAVIGLGPLTRMAMLGVHMYAKLMGQNKPSTQAKPFDSLEKALDYLASES
jgi:hypothetical protein